VPPRDPDQRLKEQGRFGIADFRYDAAADLYRCPANAELRPMRGQKRKASGKLVVRYASRQAVCRTCPLRAQCLAANGKLREIERWVHEAVIERHQARMRIAGEDMMRRRKALAEHPFGTLKCRAGYRHFLVRGFAKVRGEWSLMALCYNFSRVLRIVGLDRWRALLAQRAAKPPGWLIVALVQVVSPRQPPRCRALASVRQFRRVLHLCVQRYVITRSSGLTCPASARGPRINSGRCPWLAWIPAGVCPRAGQRPDPWAGKTESRYKDVSSNRV
jgi:DDE family transposase